VDGGAPGAPSTGETGSGTPHRSVWRRWAFRLLAVLLVPALALGLVESGLRLAGYGYETAFLRPTRIGQREVWVENDQFGLRFFPRAMARTPPPVVLPAHKPAGTYRIFLFGESAALGDPRPAYGMGRYLEVLLRERYPGTKFEVICVAMTAVNSHAILPIARACAPHEGDLWILYLGNNEMAGPFGANTVFGPQAPSWRWVRASLALQATRTGQGMAALAKRLKGTAAEPAGWAGLKMFSQSQLAPDDPRREVVYRNFEQNFEDIVSCGLEAGARVLVSTVAVNLRDCAPFASRHTGGLAEPNLVQWEQRWQEGKRLEAEARFQDALAAYGEAATLDARFAELQYRRGVCWLALTNQEAARPCFIKARDDDALPFRADTRLNEIVSEVAARFAGRGVELLDAPAALAEHGPTGLPGRESFYEHAHLTFAGNYWLGRAMAEAVAPSLPVALTAGARPGWASQERCEERLGLTDWNRHGALENMLGRVLEAPYTQQANHAEQARALREEWAAAKARLHPRAYLDARFVYEQAVGRAPDDHRLHENFAEFLEATDQLAEAAQQWQHVRDLLPHHYLPWFHVGRLAARQRQYPEAETALGRALELRPDLAEAHLELGKSQAAQGKLDLALAKYREAQRLRPDDARVPFEMANVLAAQGQRPAATEQLRAAIALRPTYWEARYLLGVELAMERKVKEAQAEFEEVIRLRPDYVRAHLNLGVALAQQLDLRGALVHFRETLRLDPTNQTALGYLQQAQAFLSGQTNAAPAPSLLAPPNPAP